MLKTPSLNFVAGSQELFSRPLYMLGSDGMVVRMNVSAEFLGNCEAEFGAAFANARVGLKNVLLDTHVWGSRKEQIIFKHTKELPMVTYWKRDTDSRFVPTFRAGPDAVKFQFTWDLAPLASRGITLVTVIQDREVFLALEVADKDTDKYFWVKPPFGNLFDDCRMCTGDSFPPANDAMPLGQRMQVTMAHIEASVWNSDLISEASLAAVKKLLRFGDDKINAATVDEQEEVIRGLPKVATPVLDEISAACTALGI